ncbi:PAS domain S-box-containing protein/diguanylate cyclase (GGDEF)-like protein [Pseudoduganella flava]|uniref:EAL domain-containing protein n=1 Tax=Pseudoduganella flava TaxID=871742 RepID=A0A562PQX2_9BURK|nr:bifunctional diguanylate cyclase/phosphodiesterase [Pseudoduganella flava]QGZ37965.1 EAL domain-containing protein [Pseudoduganella flava]TWI46809.1 PAS domain S-box-containing protein/diguanylate cyclase (GGDEF)-like protein [Pseudoduganella flava]
MKADETAARTNLRLRELLDHLPAGVVVHRADGSVSDANRAAQRILGRDHTSLPRAAASRDDWVLMDEDGQPLAEHDHPMWRVLHSRRELSDLVVGLRRPGDTEPCWLLCSGYPVLDHAGAVCEVVICFIDCTQLKEAEARLRKSEERLRLALLGSTDATWDVDLRTGECHYSDRWWDMLGYPPQVEAVDQSTWRRYTHPDDIGSVSEFIRALLTGHDSTFAIEMRLAHRDGHYVPVLSRGFVLRDGSGRAVRLSGTNTDLTERKEHERRIHDLAYFDQLTGLPNRRHLLEQLRRIALRTARTASVGALLFVDLDNFKQINDAHGHEAGDRLLCQVAERLRHSVRDTDQLARLGGDEFAVALEELAATPGDAAIEAGKVARKILDVLARPHALARPGAPPRNATITPSIGIALFGKEVGSVEAALRQADIAMYHAKRAGRDTLRFFDPAMQAAIEQRSTLEADLRDGLGQHAFPLHCQPQFNAEGRLVGGEVLVRWQHPRRGLVGPGEFIDLAESTGLIVAIGLEALREACVCLERWAHLPGLAHLALAVNVSVCQLQQPDFAERVLAVLAETGAPPERLSLELTESAFAGDVQDVIAKMARLRTHGVLFSLDDFGTGYSSLSYLKRFPLSTLKVDRSFVSGVDAEANAGAIAELIVALGKTLGLKVIAEGVENERQFAFLREQHCDAFQGFLFAPPLPLDEFEQRYQYH